MSSLLETSHTTFNLAPFSPAVTNSTMPSLITSNLSLKHLLNTTSLFTPSASTLPSIELSLDLSLSTQPRPQSDFSDLYTISHKLGDGGYGSVYLCSRCSDHKLFAVKIVPDNKCRRKTWCEDRNYYIPDEVILWEPLSHPNILQLEEVFYESNNWLMVMEYDPDYVDLFNYINKGGPLASEEASHIIKQLINVCWYLTLEDVDHRDIKDENILYNPATREIKLIDFGSASVLTDEPYCRFQGTDVYIPPEYYRSLSYYPYPATTWALGCLTYVLLTGDTPFPDRKAVCEHKVVPWSKNVDSVGKNFVELCLNDDPIERLPLCDVLYHPWFNAL